MNVERLIRELSELPVGSDIEIDGGRDLIVTFPSSIRRNAGRLDAEQGRHINAEGSIWHRYGSQVYTSELTTEE